MILNLTLGFMPASFALDLDLNHHVTGFESIPCDSKDRGQAGRFEAIDLIGCQDFSVCVMHYSCVPLHSSIALTVTPQRLMHRTIWIDDVRFLTRYLGIPRRPPRA